MFCISQNTINFGFIIYCVHKRFPFLNINYPISLNGRHQANESFYFDYIFRSFRTASILIESYIMQGWNLRKIHRGNNGNTTIIRNKQNIRDVKNFPTTFPFGICVAINQKVLVSVQSGSQVKVTANFNGGIKKYYIGRMNYNILLYSWSLNFVRIKNYYFV